MYRADIGETAGREPGLHSVHELRSDPQGRRSRLPIRCRRHQHIMQQLDRCIVYMVNCLVYF